MSTFKLCYFALACPRSIFLTVSLPSGNLGLGLSLIASHQPTCTILDRVIPSAKITQEGRIHGEDADASPLQSPTGVCSRLTDSDYRKFRTLLCDIAGNTGYNNICQNIQFSGDSPQPHHEVRIVDAPTMLLGYRPTSKFCVNHKY